MMSRSLKDLHPTLVKVWQDAVVAWAQTYPDSPKPFLSCTYRSNEEQTALYASGRTVKGKILTKAKAGQSPHNYLPSLAFDVAFSNNGIADWRPFLFERFAAIVEKVSNEVFWGGKFITIPDRPHFELKGWRQSVGK